MRYVNFQTVLPRSVGRILIFCVGIFCVVAAANSLSYARTSFVIGDRADLISATDIAQDHWLDLKGIGICGREDTLLLAISAPTNLSWDPNLDSYFSSLRMIDLFGGILVTVDMLTNSSYTISNGAITQVMIISKRCPGETIVIPLTLRDEGTGRQLLTFGYHPKATYCIDGKLDSGLIESELPPTVPGWFFDARFVDSRFGIGECLGQGTLINLHGYRQMRDTFQISFQPGTIGSPITISWPEGSDEVFSYLHLRDLFGGILIDVDMLAESELIVVNPGINRLMIIAERRPSEAVLFPITVKDNGTGASVDTFGFHPRATYCIDGLLDFGLTERELPPIPPSGGYDSRFTDSRPQGGCIGEGLQLNVHGFDQPSDTFQLKFQSGSGGYPMRIYWQPDFHGFFSSLRLTDIFGGILVNVDMLSIDSAAITSSSITNVWIIGRRQTSSIDTSPKDVVRSLEVLQTYPNPFNASTRFEFRVMTAGLVTLKIFNLLGQEVATAVDEFLPPGSYSSSWEPLDLPSGIYFYRFHSGEFLATRSLILLR